MRDEDRMELLWIRADCSADERRVRMFPQMRVDLQAVARDVLIQSNPSSRGGGAPLPPPCWAAGEEGG